MSSNFQPAFYERDYMDLQRMQAEDDLKPKPTLEQLREFCEAEAKTAADRLQEQRNNEACESWVFAHPEYRATRRNGMMMTEWVQARRLPVNEDTLNQAFAYLSEKGIISDNRSKVEAEVQKKFQQGEIARKADAIAAERRLNAPTRDELYSMSLEELRNLSITGRRR